MSLSQVIVLVLFKDLFSCIPGGAYVLDCTVVHNSPSVIEQFCVACGIRLISYAITHGKPVAACRAQILAKKVSARAFKVVPGKQGEAAGEIGIEGTTIEAPTEVCTVS